MRLADVTTLRLGGDCADVVVADTGEQIVSTVVAADADDVPLLVLSGGSNVVISDDGWPGRVMLVRSRGIAARGDEVEVAAGEPWSEVVDEMVAAGRTGMEALAGIPGATGSTPIQNVGAYGQEVASSIRSVTVWDRAERRERHLSADECEFGYRDSVFKRHTGRYVVLSVRFCWPATGLSQPVRYAELAGKLGLPIGAQAPVAVVAAAVLDLRRRKGMVLDNADHDTWSAGSFFTNPILDDADAVPDGAPAYPTADRRVKTSAAWLIEHAGFGKGYATRAGAPASLSTKHTLALTNRGGAATADLLDLARTVRDGVTAQFGITLVPEPVLVGCSL